MSTPHPGTHAQRHVLYVEDQPVNVMLMQELFRTSPQWQLHIAGDGASALRMLDTLHADLLLIDMHLPDTDGLSLLRDIKARFADAQAPCIGLSADALPEQIARARQAGFDDYWTKPINVVQVLGHLQRLLS